LSDLEGHSLMLSEIFLLPFLGNYGMCQLRCVHTWIGMRTWIVISTLTFSKMKDVDISRPREAM